VLTGILSVVFLIGVPIWLVVEEVLHRSRIRLRAGRPVEFRRSVRQPGASNRYGFGARARHAMTRALSCGFENGFVR
jgi:hypothetical protein